jgi:hypothetical protein
MDNADIPSEKTSRSFSSRIVGSKRAGRPGTSDGSPSSSPFKKSSQDDASGETSEKKEKTLKPLTPAAAADIKPKEQKDPTLLRKRTSSAAEVPRLKKEENGALSALKSGQSILEQIGTPDHNGWMRKKGDRYNSWKLRYFVLKGPHLYILRSNNKTVSSAIHSCAYLLTQAHRKLRSRVTSIPRATRLSQTKILILGVTGSGLSTRLTRHTISAQRNRSSFASG